MATSRDLEAKIVVLGSSGVGKTSLLTRYIHNKFEPPSQARPTIGATFLTKRLLSQDSHPPTQLRLQIWDTAGQERFRSISKLYYRGANAALLCYDITNEESFIEMGVWLDELKRNTDDDCVIHVVGTKADIVAENPDSRRVPFERCIQYIAESLYGPAAQRTQSGSSTSGASAGTPVDHRNSGFWGMDTVWDSCHEISAKDGEGIDEVFRVITRKLVEQRSEKEQQMASWLEHAKTTGAIEDRRADYFESADKKGSFRVGVGDKRRSWLAFPSSAAVSTPGDTSRGEQARRGRCC